MKQKQIEIWNYLTKNALGIDYAKHIEVIASAIGEPPQGTNNDNVRNWITDMVLNHGKPIGTCIDGAFIILNDTEREIAAKFVERNNRANAVRNNGNYIP